MEGIFSVEWITALSSILLLDLILSGDNAILIALACKNLPAAQKTKAIVLGGVGAVAIRIVLTLFATNLLAIAYLQFIGGLALIYIAIKLLTDQAEAGDDDRQAPTALGAAVKTILVADFIMSMDNILSMAGVANTVSDGKWSLIISGLLISIPVVLCGAQLFSLILQRFPAIIYIGSGILAYTAGKMIVMDQALGMYFAAYDTVLEISLVALVLSLGWYLNQQQAAAAEYINNEDRK